MLKSALDHYERQQRLTAAALVAVRRRKWTDVRSIALIVALFQQRAVEDALASIDPMLAEQGLDAPLGHRVDARQLAGTASDGRPLVSLFQQAASPDALALMVATQIQDAARGAAGLSIGLRGHGGRIGWIRMLNPPSCSRCAILAGKFYRHNQGFARHPKCDCRHIPAAEDTGRDLRTDPDLYFRSLTTAEQHRIFTKAGAEAIRLGADVGQVVNARRVTSGMQFAGAPAVKVTPNYFGAGKARQVTFEGTTNRGLFGKAELARQGEFAKIGQFNRATRGRLMPETILMLAKSDADAVRILRNYRFIL